MPILYDEPADAYFANTAIGSTDVRNFIRSPTLFVDARKGICERETAAMLFGTATHLAVLEPRRYAETVAIKPKGMNFSTSEGKAWRKEKQEAGKTIITDAEAEHLFFMHKRMPREVHTILSTARTEVTVRTKIGEHDVQCRIDVRTLGMDYDLKSISAIEKIDKAICDRGYHIQQRWYQRVVAAETGTKAPPFRFLFVESKPPYRWRIVELDLDFTMAADTAIDEALAEISARNHSGCWDDRDHLHYMASPPAWMSDSMSVGDAEDDEEVA